MDGHVEGIEVMITSGKFKQKDFLQLRISIPRRMCNAKDSPFDFTAVLHNV
jgi:hypothetical protein